MDFVDALLILVMFLIFMVIMFHIFMYGRDLVVFPRRLQRVPDYDRYPGSPEYDEYTDDESDSDSDDENGYNDYNRGHSRNRHRYPNPKKVASYVASHLPQ